MMRALVRSDLSQVVGILNGSRDLSGIPTNGLSEALGSISGNGADSDAQRELRIAKGLGDADERKMDDATNKFVESFVDRLLGL